MLSRRLPASRDISVSGVRGEPEPETVNHRTKLTPSSLRSPLASLHTPCRRTNRFMDPNVPPTPPPRSVTQTHSSNSRRHLSKIYFLEASIDFFINNRPPDRPPTGKSLDLLSPPLATSLDRLIARRSARRYSVKHFTRQCSGIMYSENLEGIQPTSCRWFSTL